MRRASLILASLLALCACGGGNTQTAGKTKAERFPVPDDLVGTSFVLECTAAKAKVKEADEALAWLEDEYLADPEVGDATRDYYKKRLPGYYGRRAAYVAANPKCFDVARLEEAHKYIDGAKRRYENWRKGDPA